MELEARSLQASMKAYLFVKLKEYETDLNNLKSELKRITSVANNNNDELLELGQADTLAFGEQEKHAGNRGAWCLQPPRFASTTPVTTSCPQHDNFISFQDLYSVGFDGVSAAQKLKEMTARSDACTYLTHARDLGLFMAMRARS
ncbi:Vesicle transport v-SNARE [Arachis hypogaea]|nr:Vesicle transport v-SNARE [Arachis hypogaea]